MTTFFPKPLDKQVAAISDSLLQTQDGLAIVANGNTHAAISSGQFVYVKGHDMLSEGLYKATSAIEANGALSTSNLTPDGAGGLNDLQSQITSLNSNIENKVSLRVVSVEVTPSPNQYVTPYSQFGYYDVTLETGEYIVSASARTNGNIPAPCCWNGARITFLAHNAENRIVTIVIAKNG